MKRLVLFTGIALATICACQMENPLLEESQLPYGAPQFDKIKTEHYLPAFEQAIKEAKAEVDAIVANPDAPTFANTIEAMEFNGGKFNDIASIFYNLMEADTNDEIQFKCQKRGKPYRNCFSVARSKSSYSLCGLYSCNRIQV